MKKNAIISAALAGLLLFCGCSLQPSGNMNVAPEDPVKPVAEEPETPDVETPVEENKDVVYEFDFDSEDTNDWQKAFNKKLQEFATSQGADPDVLSENTYFLANVEGNNNTDIPELCIRTGTCEADYELIIFSYVEETGEVIQIVGNGKISAGHTTFYKGMYGDFYGYSVHMGYVTLFKYTNLVDGEPLSEVVKEMDLNTDPDAEYPTMIELVNEDIQPLTFIPVTTNAYLLWYEYMPYKTADADVAKAEEAIANTIKDNKEVYVVAGEQYYTGKTGLMNLNDLLEKGAIDKYRENDMTFSRYILTDANFDGQKETMLELVSTDSNGNNSYAYVLLSYQDGVVYAYAFANLSNADGEIGFCEYDVFNNWCESNYGYRSFKGFLFTKDQAAIIYSDKPAKDADVRISESKWVSF